MTDDNAHTQDADRVRSMLSMLIEKLEEEINNPHAGKSKHGYLWGKADAATLLVRLTNLLITLNVKKTVAEIGHLEPNGVTAEEAAIDERFYARNDQ